MDLLEMLAEYGITTEQELDKALDENRLDITIFVEDVAHECVRDS